MPLDLEAIIAVVQEVAEVDPDALPPEPGMMTIAELGLDDPIAVADLELALAEEAGITRCGQTIPTLDLSPESTVAEVLAQANARLYPEVFAPHSRVYPLSI